LSRTARRITVALVAAALAALATLPAGTPARDRAVSHHRRQFELVAYVVRTQWRDPALAASEARLVRREAREARERARRRRERAERRRRERRREERLAAERAQEAKSSTVSTDGQVSTASPVTAPAAASSGSPQEIAEGMLAAAGWGGQWTCFNNIITRESGWNVTAENPNSGAYGLPQALPGEKMGPGWQDSAYVQLHWVIDEYIPSAYGTPCGAWAFWQAHSWY
jgi:hypothetical protein